MSNIFDIKNTNIAGQVSHKAALDPIFNASLIDSVEISSNNIISSDSQLIFNHQTQLWEYKPVGSSTGNTAQSSSENTTQSSSENTTQSSNIFSSPETGNDQDLFAKNIFANGDINTTKQVNRTHPDDYHLLLNKIDNIDELTNIVIHDICFSENFETIAILEFNQTEQSLDQNSMIEDFWERRESNMTDIGKYDNQYIPCKLHICYLNNNNKLSLKTTINIEGQIDKISKQVIQSQTNSIRKCTIATNNDGNVLALTLRDFNHFEPLEISADGYSYFRIRHDVNNTAINLIYIYRKINGNFDLENPDIIVLDFNNGETISPDRAGYYIELNDTGDVLAVNCTNFIALYKYNTITYSWELMYNNDNEFKIPIYNESGITYDSTYELSRIYSLNSNKEGAVIKFGGDVFCIKKSIVNILPENSANNIIFIKLENNIWTDITEELALETMYVIDIFSKKNENLFAISYINYYDGDILLNSGTFKLNFEEDKMIKLKIIKKIDNLWSKNNLDFPMSEFRTTWNSAQTPTKINNFLDVSFKNDYLIFNTLYYHIFSIIETHIYKFDNNSNNYIREHRFLVLEDEFSGFPNKQMIYTFKFIDNNYNILYIFHDMISSKSFLKKQINRFLGSEEISIYTTSRQWIGIYGSNNVYYFKYDQSNLFTANIGLKFNSDDTNSYISSNYGSSFKNIITVPIFVDNPTHNLTVNTGISIDGILDAQTNVNIGGNLTVTGNINTTHKFLPLNSIILWDSSDENIPSNFVKLNADTAIQLGNSNYYIIKYVG